MVYLELTRELATLEKQKESKDNELKALEETFSGLEPRTREKRVAEENYHKLKEEIRKLEQQVLYLRLRLHSRMEQDRKEYMEARRLDKEWPNPKSYETFQLKKKLSSAPKTWKRGKDSSRHPAETKHSH